MIKKQRFCCVKELSLKTVITEAQNHHLEFKGYQIEHINPQKTQIIFKTICSILNSESGTILFGIAQNKVTKLRQVIGISLMLQERLAFQEYLKKIGQKFYPRVQVGRQLRLSYIPVTQIQSSFVIRLNVTGNPKYLYSFRLHDRDQFYLRNDNQCKKIRQKPHMYSQILNRFNRNKKGLTSNPQHRCPSPQPKPFNIKKKRYVKSISLLDGPQIIKQNKQAQHFLEPIYRQKKVDIFQPTPRPIIEEERKVFDYQKFPKPLPIIRIQSPEKKKIKPLSILMIKPIPEHFSAKLIKALTQTFPSLQKLLKVELIKGGLELKGAEADLLRMHQCFTTKLQPIIQKKLSQKITIEML